MRKCHCAGHCGPAPIDYSRREFLGLLGTGAAALIARPALGAFELPADEWERWRRQLLAPASPRRYSSDRHTDARLHLGGIGTGNFEIGADGQFTTWQLFNTLRDGQVPLYLLARAGGTSRLLQTKGGPDWPRVSRIEMTGEYPLAHLRFQDDALPVRIELSAFSPFAPLATRLSSMPVAALVFHVHNPGPEPQTVSLAALMQNPVGYDAAGDNATGIHACFGANVNEVVHEANLTGLLFRAEAGSEPTLDQAATIVVGHNLRPIQDPPDRPANLRVDVLEKDQLSAAKVTDPAHTVIWVEQPATGLPEAFLVAAREAVQAGATLLFSGRSQPLLSAYATWTGGKPVSEVQERPDIVFEDFEHGYEQWTIEGEAFGKEPAHGTLAGQQAVTGYRGSGLVNSFLNGDAPTGKLISKPFTVTRRFIRFLIGGGDYDNTQMRLVVDGKVVHATSGKSAERLESAAWDVSAWENQTAHIEIVDQQTGGWGHINIDQIEFGDMPCQRSLLALLEELLPARFSGMRRPEGAGEPARRLQFENLTLQPGASKSAAPDGTELLMRSLGQGKVVLAAGAVLDPAEAATSHCRRQALGFVCSLVGAHYAATPGHHPKAPGFGSLALATLAPGGTVQPVVTDWSEGWKTFAEQGRFTEAKAGWCSPATAAGHTLNGAVAASVTVPAGKSVDVPFLLAWHYPNKYSHGGAWMGCHYATQWTDAGAVLREAAAGFGHWRRLTEHFRNTFYDSTLPYWLLDCLTANAAILRHIGIVFRIANGDTYGWEGSNGCCDPTCTHVWGYEQTLARLFPDLEKEMRRIDFRHQQGADGGVNNRTDVPSPSHPSGEHPFADGHASCILKAYREALNHADEGFFHDYWPHIRRAVDYLIDRDAKSHNGEAQGYLEDDQWNTYDEALHGVTTFISGYYLAALRAGEEWARRMGDAATAQRFHAVFAKGQAKLVELCWNGEYFQQQLPDYMSKPGEVGPGCMADQLIGQWWAHQLGLGYILPKEKVVTALKSVFRYNFKSDLTGWKHMPRAFAGDKDKGLLICTWPKGGRPPGVMLYSDEVWTGIEYQVAAHLIYEGLIEEGFAVVKAARDRYDGVPRAPIGRNPWNEIECGGHYARAMSSWSLLLGLSGWEYDGPRRVLRWSPRHTPELFQSCFTATEGWGTLRQARRGRAQTNQLGVHFGQLLLSELVLSPGTTPASVKVHLDQHSVWCEFSVEADQVRIAFKQPVRVAAGQMLKVEMV